MKRMILFLVELHMSFYVKKLFQETLLKEESKKNQKRSNLSNLTVDFWVAIIRYNLNDGSAKINP